MIPYSRMELVGMTSTTSMRGCCETEVTLGGPWGGRPQNRAEGIGTWCGEYADEYEWAAWHMKHCLHETELCRSECYEFWQSERYPG
jgi:hypothetical protein